MKKPLKIGLIGVAILIVLFLAAAITLVATVDPNDYKMEITQAVKKQTGRDLSFDGDIEFKFFPWLGLQVGPVALGNAYGFAPKEMIRINRAEASIQIMPLLRGTIAIGTVVLDGLNVNLAVNKQGINNWDDLQTKNEGKTTSTTDTASEASGTDSSFKLTSFSVEGVKITNVTITYDDMQAGTRSSISNMNLIIGVVGNTLPTPFELDFQIKLDNPAVETTPKLTGIATFDKDAGTIKLTQLALSLLNLNITGDFFAKTDDKNIHYSGTLTLAEFSAKELMQQLGMEPLKTNDPNALTKVGATVKINGTTNSVSMEEISIALDDTMLTGTGAVHNFTQPDITVSVNIDDIDADRYMPPATTNTKQTVQTTESQSPTKSATSAKEPDLSALKTLQLRAQMTIGTIKAMNLRVHDILMHLIAQNGVVTIKPFSASLYEGTLSAESFLDTNKPLAQWTESAELRNIQAGPLLKDLVGKDHILGTTAVKYNVSGAGLTPRSMQSSVTGTASFAFEDGAINGINIAKMIRDALNTIKGTSTSNEEAEKTDFAELLGSAVITNGHISNNDLLMKSPLLRITGKGWADLPNNSVDYLATVTVVGTLKGQNGDSIEELTGLPLPIYAKGTLSDPSIGLDGKALAEALFKGTFKDGAKDIEKNLRESILGGTKSDNSDSESQTNEKKINPGLILKKIFQ